MDNGGFATVTDAKGNLVVRSTRFIPASRAADYAEAWRKVGCRVSWERPVRLPQTYDRIAHLLVERRNR